MYVYIYIYIAYIYMYIYIYIADVDEINRALLDVDGQVYIHGCIYIYIYF